MYNISTREGESYFLRTLPLHKSGATSLENMRFHEGVQYSTFRDTCFALGVLSDNTEWLRCMLDAFTFDFDRLTEVFSIIMGFCERSNHLRIWEGTKDMMITDFRRRHPVVFLYDELAQDYVLNEILNSLTEISPALTLESLKLPTLPERSYEVLTDDATKGTNSQTIESISTNTKTSTKTKRLYSTLSSVKFYLELQLRIVMCLLNVHLNTNRLAFALIFWMHLKEQGKHLLSVKYNQF